MPYGKDRGLFSVIPFWFEKPASRRGRAMCLYVSFQGNHVWLLLIVIPFIFLRGIRCSLDFSSGLEIALDCVFDCKYPYEHKEVIFSTRKQAFGELRLGFEGVIQGCFNKDTYASACWKGSSANRRRAKSYNRK